MLQTIAQQNLEASRWQENLLGYSSESNMSQNTEQKILIEKKRLASPGEHCASLTLEGKAIAAILGRMAEKIEILSSKINELDTKRHPE